MAASGQYLSFLSEAASVEYLDVDVETDGGDFRVGQGHITGMSLGYKKGIDIHAMYFPLFHEYGENVPPYIELALHALFEKFEGYLVFHNAKFDIPVLQATGFHVDIHRHYCTMLMAHLLCEHTPRTKSLEACCKYYVNDESFHEKKKSPQFAAIEKTLGWGAIPAELMAEYGEQDARMGIKLFFTLLPKFRKEGLDTYWQQKMNTTKMLITMERRGVAVDTDKIEHNLSVGYAVMDEIAEELGVNPSSPKGLKELLLDRLGLPVVRLTGTGKPSFDAKAMEEYEVILATRGTHEANLILEFRGWQKSLSTFYEKYKELMADDGRVHAHYHMHRTVTGRFSCSKPNLQQIPKSAKKGWQRDLRTCFIAKPGFTLVSFDYSQLELRIGAAYAKEESLIEVFADDTRDVFTEMSQALNMSRPDTKTLVYSTQYGGGVKRISDVFGVSSARAQQLRTNYFTTYPGFKKISDLAAHKAKSAGYVKLWTGRRRHFEWPSSEARKAFNSICQGGAADIVENAMWRAFTKYDNEETCRLLMQVHDELVWEIRDDLVDDLVPKIAHEMADIPGNWGVHFAVDHKVWGTK